MKTIPFDENFKLDAKYQVELNKTAAVIKNEKNLVTNQNIRTSFAPIPSVSEKQQYRLSKEKIMKTTIEETKKDLYEQAKDTCGLINSYSFYDRRIWKSVAREKVFDSAPIIIIVITLIVFLIVCFSVNVPGVDWSSFRNWGQNIQLWWNMCVELKYWIILVIGIIIAIMWKPTRKILIGRKNCIESVSSKLLADYNMKVKVDDPIEKLKQFQEETEAYIQEQKVFDYGEAYTSY